MNMYMSTVFGCKCTYVCLHMRMLMCACAYVHMHLQMHMHMFMYLHMYMYLYMLMHLHMHMYLHLQMQEMNDVFANVYVFVSVFVYVNAYVYVNICKCRCKCVYIYICIYIYMIPSPAHDTPSNALRPPGRPLYLVVCWYLVPLGIPTHAMRILKSNSLPTTWSYVCIYIYNYNPLYTPDKPCCYILCLYTTYRLSTCYIFTIYALST